MSSYCTEQNLIDRLGEAEIRALTDYERVDWVSPDTLARAIEAASAEIDGYLSRRYGAPLASAPDRIVDCACILTRCRLYTHDRPADVAGDCDGERQWLQRVADGRLDVPGLDEISTAQSAGSVQMSGDARVFGRDNSSDF